MTLEELNLINSKGTAVVNKLYTVVDGARVTRYFIGVHGGRVREIDDPKIQSTTNQKILDLQDQINNLDSSGEADGGNADTSGAVVKTFECGETISAGYAVSLVSGLLYNFDITDNSHYGKCIGISVQTGNTGDDIEVTLQGTNTSVSGLTEGYQFVAAGGTLSITAPSTGIVQTVGIAKDATTLEVQIQKPYIKI